MKNKLSIFLIIILFVGLILGGCAYGNTHSSVSFSLISGSEGTLDKWNRFPSNVLKDTNDYKLYYYANNARGKDYRLFYADSHDGVTWKNFQMIMDTGGNALEPMVLKVGETYHLWFNNNSPGTSGSVDGSWIEHGSSTDGKQFSNRTTVIKTGAQGVYDSVGLTGPHVIYNNGLYEMWYSGWDGKHWRILYANSSDGLNWDNFTLALGKSTGGLWDIGGAATPTVILEDGVYRIWYEAYNKSVWQVGYGESTTGKAPWNNMSLAVVVGSQGVYDSSQIYTPVVYTVGGLKHMLYSGLSLDDPFKIIHVVFDG